MEKPNKLSSPSRTSQPNNSSKSSDNTSRRTILSKDQLGLIESSFQLLMNSPQSMRTGFTTKSLHWPEKFTSDQEPESDSCPTFTVDFTEERSDQKDINTLVPKSSDGDCNNSKSKNSSRRTRRETALRLTPELSLMREEAPWPESSPNILKAKPRDCR